MRVLRELTAFSVPLFIDGLAERFREMAEQVLIGRALGAAGLGYFRYGYRIALMPSLAAIQICGYVLFPAFSRIAGDKSRFRASFLRALGWIWFVALPTAALMVILGEPLAVLLLGEQWREAGYVAGALAGLGLGQALCSVTGEAMKGAGRSSLLIWLSVIGIAVGIPLVVLLLPFGLVGVGVAISLGYLAIGVASIILARPVVGFSFRDAASRLLPPTVTALAAFGFVFPLEHLVVQSERYAVPAGLAWILVECVLFTLIYVGALRFIAPSWYRSVQDGLLRGVAKLTKRSVSA